ncbi:hypothetical protein BsWGS_16305 [Bradybaena similaris]
MAESTQLFYEDWANLPDPILTQVFSYLSEVERCRVGATCKHWLQCLETPQLWRTFKCVFELPEDRKHIKCIKKYGHFISRLTIVMNYMRYNYYEQEESNPAVMLYHLSCLKNVRLSYLSIVFHQSTVGGNEYFGKALQKLFIKIGEKKEKSTLKHLDLPCLPKYFNDNLVEKISETCPNLEYLNFESTGTLGRFYLNHMVTLVLKCRKIQELNLYYTHLSDDVLKALSETDRKPLQRLGIVYSIYDDNKRDLSSVAWSSLLTANPDLKVSLRSEFLCPADRILEIMKPEIPVQELCLSYDYRSPIYPVINKAVAYYEQILEKLVVSCDPSRELQESLLDAARRCKKLKALYVYRVLDKDVIDQILELCPLMRDTRDYILKSSKDGQWIVKKEECD